MLVGRKLSVRAVGSGRACICLFASAMRLFNCPKLSERKVVFVGETGRSLVLVPTIIGVGVTVGRATIIGVGLGDGSVLVTTTIFDGVGVGVVTVAKGVGFAPTTITRSRDGFGACSAICANEI